MRGAQAEAHSHSAFASGGAGKRKQQIRALRLGLPLVACGVAAEHSGQATKHGFGLLPLDAFNEPG